MNFGDQAKLSLPESIDVSFHGGPDGSECQWYGSWDPEDLHVGFWIRTDDVKLLDEENQTEIAVSEAFYEQSLEGFIGDPQGINVLYRTPEGAIAYDIYDDEEAGENDEAHRKHLWQYMHFSHGTARVLHVLVMLPFVGKDSPLLAKLISFLEREVPRAVFPELE